MENQISAVEMNMNGKKISSDGEFGQEITIDGRTFLVDFTYEEGGKTVVSKVMAGDTELKVKELSKYFIHTLLQIRDHSLNVVELSIAVPSAMRDEFYTAADRNNETMEDVLFRTVSNYIVCSAPPF